MSNTTGKKHFDGKRWLDCSATIRSCSYGADGHVTDYEIELASNTMPTTKVGTEAINAERMDAVLNLSPVEIRIRANISKATRQMMQEIIDQGDNVTTGDLFRNYQISRVTLDAYNAHIKSSREPNSGKAFQEYSKEMMMLDNLTDGKAMETLRQFSRTSIEDEETGPVLNRTRVSKRKPLNPKPFGVKVGSSFGTIEESSSSFAPKPEKTGDDLNLKFYESGQDLVAYDVGDSTYAFEYDENKGIVTYTVEDYDDGDIAIQEIGKVTSRKDAERVVRRYIANRLQTSNE